MEYSDDTKHTWSMILVAFLVEAIAEVKVAKRKAKRKRTSIIRLSESWDRR